MTEAAPGGFAPGPMEAAQGTLGGAVAVADQLPSRRGVELLGTAHEAFVQALELTAAICAFLVMATAMVTLLLLRRPGPARRPCNQSSFRSSKVCL